VKRAIASALAAVASALLMAATASAATPGVEHLHFHAGPYRITPGANLILLDTHQIPKPSEDGYMVRFAPNLRYASKDGQCCGAVPRVDVIHLHHGVWASNGQTGLGEGNGYIGGFYPFVATGEEKTIFSLPRGYGYPIGAKDAWVLNYMIHNLTARPATVYITYDIDFIPSNSPAAVGIKAAHPLWMDVEDHHIYPVFDVHRYSGKDGKFTFPDMAQHPVNYLPGQQPLNVFNVDHAGTLLGTAGHLHPGGLYDELDMIRPGATPSHGAIRGPVPHSVRLFRSYAHYFDKRGPISWDMAMTATAPDWRVHVQPGEQLRISATYETRRASWYESMGIMVVWEAWDDTAGIDPFAHKLDQRGHVTHGHLPENNHHGGNASLGVNLKKFPACRTDKVLIVGFSYTPGDFTASGRNRCTPTVKEGRSITFDNKDSAATADFNPFAPSAAYADSIFHSVTACQYPCGLNTGISYPLANGAGSYDSGQLGPALPATGNISWSTPTSLKPGTYTFYCRIHPFMRGVFRIIK
jgi:plastocyanin